MDFKEGLRDPEGHEAIVKEFIGLTQRCLEGPYELSEQPESCEVYRAKGIISVKHAELEGKSGTSDQNR
eukprot:7280443-Alexandrium_andersonii.AAC.1